MDFSFLPKYYNFYIDGVKTTLLLALFTVVLSSVLGIILALMKLSKNPILKAVSTSYIEFIRGTPLMVQLFIIFYGLKRVIEFPDFKFAGTSFDFFMPCVLTLAINSGAYVAEIFRAGIQAVDKGQMEAARSLGMTHGMAMRYIILPQAIRNILPALGNELVILIKESAVVMVVGVGDLMYKTQTIRGLTYNPFAPLLVVAVIYFIITFTLSKLLGVAERRLRASDHS